MFVDFGIWARNISQHMARLSPCFIRPFLTCSFFIEGKTIHCFVLNMCFPNTALKYFFSLIFYSGRVWKTCLTNFSSIVYFLIFVFLSKKPQKISKNYNKFQGPFKNYLWVPHIFFQSFHLILEQ